MSVSNFCRLLNNRQFKVTFFLLSNYLSIKCNIFYEDLLDIRCLHEGMCVYITFMYIMLQNTPAVLQKEKNPVGQA